MNYTVDEIWDLLINYNVATDNELRLVTAINGYNEEALLDVLYARAGLRSIEQLLNEY